MKILLLGKSGMLGSCFLKVLAGESFELFGFDYDKLDITDYEALKTAFKNIKPNIVVNCAAYTAVDDCEKNSELALKVNGEACGEIAKLCKEYGSVLIHFSTDYVFDGEKKDGYKEDDVPSPISVYGKSKLEGEKLIMANMEKFYIVRTSWLFGLNGKNFVDTMIELGKTKKELDVVDDQLGCPTYTKDLAGGVIDYFLTPFLGQISDEHTHWLDEEFVHSGNVLPFGIYHLTNSGSLSWNKFAKKIFELLEKNVKVNEVTTDKAPRPAKRPHYSILLNTKLKPLRNWEDALRHYLNLKF